MVNADTRKLSNHDVATCLVVAVLVAFVTIVAGA